MAYGLSDREAYRRVYWRLHKIRRQLAAAGIACVYEDRELRGNGFRIFYERLNASNGECCLLPVAVVGTDRYFFMAFERGLQRIKERR